MSVSQYYGFTNSSNMTLMERDGNTDPDKRPDNTTGDGHVTALSLSPGAAGIFIVLYSITTLLAIIGNVLTIVVFTKGKKCRTDIRPFLLNLAFADLIMALFCIPFTFSNQLLSRWIFSPPTCPIVVFLQLTAVTASVFTNTAIGIDRFYAVAFPLKSRIISQRHTIMICIIWAISISVNVIQLKVMKGRPNNKTNVMECVEDWDDNSLYTRKVYTLFILFLTYMVPLTILSITYSIVGCILWRRTLPGQVDEARDQQQNRATRKIVKMLVTIVVLFALCWLPLHAFILTVDFNPDLIQDLEPLQIIYFVAHWIAMSNSFVNPIIYVFMNSNFRYDLFILLHPFKHRSDSSASNLTLMAHWKENNSVFKKGKKLSLPAELESTKGCDNHRRKLDVTRVSSCKAF